MDGTPGSFGAAAAYRHPAPLPPAQSTLQGLLDWISGAKALYQKEGPIAGATNVLTPPLGMAMGATMPGIRMPSAPATYRGFQEGYGSAPGIHLYDLQAPIMKGGRELHPKGSTVSLETLLQHKVPYEGP